MNKITILFQAELPPVKNGVVNNLWLLVILLFANIHGYSQDYEPGDSYVDSTGFVEFIAGNVPIIISVPHGGYLEPDSIPDCPNCSSIRDAYTQEIGRGLSSSFNEQTGCYPYVIINLLHRRKLDANRDIEEATGGFALLEDAWSAYHAFIDIAKTKIEEDFGKGIFVDLHGHGHDIQRIEMGYLLSKSELQMTDDEINDSALVEESSIKELANSNLQSLTHAELLRGELSFGTLMSEAGFPSVPSLSDPFPEDDEPYFTGGFNTRRHGSRNGGQIDAIQLEFNQSIRFDEDVRDELIDSLSIKLRDYLSIHYQIDDIVTSCNVVSSNQDLQDVQDVKIFPNPALGIINLSGIDDYSDIAIINILGEEVLSQKWKGKPISISHLKSGNYFMIINSGGSIKTFKIVKIE